MGMYAVQADDSGELSELQHAARDGRAVSMQRRRQLSQGKQAVNGDGGPAAVENPPVDGAGASPAAPDGQATPNGTRGAPAHTATAADGVATAHLGRAVSAQRRRQLSQGKQALDGESALAAAAENLHVDGAGAPPAARDGQGRSDGTQGAPAATTTTDGLAAAHLGRTVSMQRRRQLSQGKQALTGTGASPAAPAGPAGQAAPNGTQGAAAETATTTDGLAAAHLGRTVSMQRRRQLSQGKQALTGAGDLSPAPAGPAGPAGQATANGTQGAPAETAAADGVAAAHLGRVISMQRRRQLSQGKQALDGEGALAAAAEKLHVDGPGADREQARARRPEASRLSGAGISRPQREGRVPHAPKVIVSPTQRDQHVTGLRIGRGGRVTGDEPGSALPISGTQYVPADGSAPALGAGPKVGLVRTPKGLVVSGTTVRNRVLITGDEAGEHLRITGEADQKFDDDLTPRSEGTYRPTQFPRRADPHGASAVGTRLGPQQPVAAPGGDGPWYPLENTDGGLAVTGTAVGRSGRVTGNEAGACRVITGDQYQHLSSYSSECGGIGGGTAPAAHINRGRLDPVTGGKVTLAQTWGGQFVTGPSVEHRPNVTGDEPGSCRPVTGTPYQGPSTAFGWCEPDEGEFAAGRLDPRPEGVALTGDIPMPAESVTGTERGEQKNVTGTPYYRDLRAAEPAADDWASTQGFPVAWARRLAGTGSDGAVSRDTKDRRPPPSSVAGGITGSFAIGDGMVTGNNEFMFRPRLKGDGSQPAVTGEGRTEGRTITGSPAAWTAHDRVTGTEGYIAAGRNPSEGGGQPHGWAGAGKFRDLATPGGPRLKQNVTGLSGWSPKAAARVTLSGGAQG